MFHIFVTGNLKIVKKYHKLKIKFRIKISEMALADLLRKPIVPIMLTATPWPPPGGMSLIFSQLVYVDYFGVGGKK